MQRLVLIVHALLPYSPIGQLQACQPAVARHAAARNSQALFRSEPRARFARLSCGDLHNPDVYVLATFSSTVISPATAGIFLEATVWVGHHRRGVLSGRTTVGSRGWIVQGRTQVALLMVALRQGCLGISNEPPRCQITIVIPADTARSTSPN